MLRRTLGQRSDLPSLSRPPGTGKGGDGRWQERSWQQDMTTSPEQHRDSVSPTPCKAKTSFDTRGPDRLAYSPSHLQPDCSPRCMFFRQYNLGMVHGYTVRAYMYSTTRGEAHSVYVLPACAVDTCLSELGCMLRV